MLAAAFMYAALSYSSAAGQILKSTYILEATTCDCGDAPGQASSKSIQFASRFDGSIGVYSTLNSLVGCHDIYLKVNDLRYKMFITLANGKDNVAYLEPMQIGSSVRDLEKNMKGVPSLSDASSNANTVAGPRLLVLDPKKYLPKEHYAKDVAIQVNKVGTASRMYFDMAPPSEGPRLRNKILGGPVWLDAKGEQVWGIVTKLDSVERSLRIVVTDISQVLDKRRYEPYHTFLKAIDNPSEECRSKRAYWDGFNDYEYKKPRQPSSTPISSQSPWLDSFREALARIRDHMRGAIPARPPATGGACLCIRTEDLEYATQAWSTQTQGEEKERWRVLANFIKCYSNLHCKGRTPGKSQFDGDIVELNQRFESISHEEISMIIDVGMNRYEIEDFIRENYALSQIISFVKKCERHTSSDIWRSNPCAQLELLSEIDQWRKAAKTSSALRRHPEFNRLAPIKSTIDSIRSAVVLQRLETFKKEISNFNDALDAIESDPCLSPSEVQMLVQQVVREKASQKQRALLDYGAGFVQRFEENIVSKIGDDALQNATIQLFRVENGIGVRLTLSGGGAIVQRNVIGAVVNASDTTSIYRPGYGLGSIGDFAAAAVAREFWDRICTEYSDQSNEFAATSLTISGWADATPIRGSIDYPARCADAIAEFRIADGNAQLAFARAWTLREQLQQSDRCGLYEGLRPEINFSVAPERGGEYRGVKVQVVFSPL